MLSAKILSTIVFSALLARFVRTGAAAEGLRARLCAGSTLLARLLACSHCLSFWLALGCAAVLADSLLEFGLITLIGWRGAHYLDRLFDHLLDRRRTRRSTAAARPGCPMCGKPYNRAFLERSRLFFCSHICWFNYLKARPRPREQLFDRAGNFIRQEVYPMSIQHIDPGRAHELLNSGDGYVYLDVRSESEFENGHPAGALNIPLLHREALGMIPNPHFLEVVEAHFERNARLLVGCQSGARSARAAEALVAAGYTAVANVKGGFGGARDQMGQVIEKGWMELGLPVEYGAEEERSYAALAGSRRRPVQ